MTEQVSTTPQEIEVGNGTVLKSVTVEDSEEMFALIDADRDYFSQYGDDTADKYKTLEDMQRRNANQSPNERRFVIRDRGTLVGFVKVTDKGELGWELGYWTGKKFAGRGYMSKAAEALTDWAFYHLGTERVFATVHRENAASVRVLQKIGYNLEGTNPKKPTDVIYARTKPRMLQEA